MERNVIWRGQYTTVYFKSSHYYIFFHVIAHCAMSSLSKYIKNARKAYVLFAKIHKAGRFLKNIFLGFGNFCFHDRILSNLFWCLKKHIYTTTLSTLTIYTNDKIYLLRMFFFMVQKTSRWFWPYCDWDEFFWKRSTTASAATIESKYKMPSCGACVLLHSTYTN